MPERITPETEPLYCEVCEEPRCFLITRLTPLGAVSACPPCWEGYEEAAAEER